MKQLKRLKDGFPQAGSGFFDLVMERAKEKGFSDARLKDAVDNLLDNFRYPQPMVSDIVSWDKRIKLHNHNDMIKLSGDFGAAVWDRYKVIKRGGQTFWVSIAEAEQYGIDIEKL